VTDFADHSDQCFEASTQTGPATFQNMPSDTAYQLHTQLLPGLSCCPFNPLEWSERLQVKYCVLINLF